VTGRGTIGNKRKKEKERAEKQKNCDHSFKINTLSKGQDFISHGGRYGWVSLHNTSIPCFKFIAMVDIEMMEGFLFLLLLNC